MHRLVWLAFGLGALLSLLLVARGQLGGDQLNLLARGWLLAERGEWIAYGNPMSTGGNTPGGVTSLLVGLPLLVARDYRVPSLVVFAGHLLAWLLLDGITKRWLGARERLLVAVVYGLHPLRLYFSGFLWNPNYLFVFGALHLWSSFVQRESSRFWPSFVQGAALVLAFQVHPSAVLLVASSGLLVLRGYFRPSWVGGIAGGLVAGLPLVPWLLELATHPVIVTGADRGFPFRGLVLVFPLLRGIGYWFRSASLFLPEKVARFDFSGVLGTDPWLGPGLTIAAPILLALTLVVPLAAHRWLLRRPRRYLRPAPSPSPRAWLRGYAVWSFVGAIAIYALAPTTPMYWQGVVLFPAAVLPVVLWAGVLWRGPRRALVPRIVAIWAAAGIVLTLAIAFGAPQYRCGGRHELRFPLDSHSPMFDDLGISRACPWPLDQPGTWWPDVLPRGE